MLSTLSRRNYKSNNNMNEIVKIQLFRIAATLPYAEVETTQHNIRLTYYEGSQEDAEKKVLVISPDEAKDIAKTLSVIADNYCYKESGEEN